MLEFTVTDVIPASPSEVFKAWLSSDGHTAMTGGEARITDRVGDDFDAWDGYICGSNLEIEPGRRFVQSWRTTQFEDAQPDSEIEVTLEPVDGGTLLTLHHTNLPDDGGHYESGWHDHYFTPMKSYFNERGGR